MSEAPIAEPRQRARKKNRNPEPLKARPKELLEQHKERYREAALQSGFVIQSMHRILAGGWPQIHVCILLTDRFEFNPNELLEMAGWPKIRAFSIQIESAE